MSKFKKGDKVISIMNTPYTQEGFTGTVAYIIPNTKYPIHVVKDDQHSSVIYAFADNELTLLKSGAVVDEKENLPEYTGGSSNYYKVFVKNPTTLEQSYEAECNDIIEALQMTFAEGNAFKAIWRKAKARQGVQKKGYDNGLYDSEKVVFFGERMVVEAKEKGNESK